MNGKTIRIGLMAPLTGIVSLYGSEISHAAQIACDEVNEAGGVLGKTLELIVVDDGSLPDSAIPAANRLIDEYGCSAMIGNLLSNTRIAVANRVAEPRKFPYLNYSFYEGSIQDRYFFHFAALPNQQIEKMIPYMVERYGSKIYFAGNDYEWPIGSIDAAKKSLLSLGGEVLGEYYLPMGSAMEEIDQVLDEVENSGADIFVPYFAGSDQINLLTEFTNRGLKKRMAVVMGHYDEAMVAHLPAHVRQGFYSTNTYFMSVNTRSNQQYLKRLEKLSDVEGIWPNGNGVLTNFGEGTYLCVKAFASAVNNANSIESEAIVNALEHVNIEGPQGNVIMDPITHHAYVNTYLARCEVDGQFKIIEQFGQITPKLPERYGHNLIKGEEKKTKSPPTMIFKASIAILDSKGKIVHQNYTFETLFSKTDSPEETIDTLLNLQLTFSEIVKEVLQNGLWEYSLKYQNQEFHLAIEAIQKSKNDDYMVHITPIRQHQNVSESILQFADIAVIATDEKGIITQANHGAYKQFEFDTGELIGLSVHLLVPPHLRTKHKTYFQSFVEGTIFEIPMGKRGEIEGYKKDGTSFPALASISKFQENEQWTMVVTLQDISKRKEAEYALTWRATHDTLTKLPNRDLIKERIEKALERSKKNRMYVGVMFIDLDHFKLVNDTFGHDIGDQLLIQVATILKEQINPGDIVGRLGGDEFVVVSDKVINEKKLIGLAQRINDAFRKPLILNKQETFVTVSIGMVLGNYASHQADEMLRDSDAAMYISKQKGRDNWNIFTDDIFNDSQQKLSIASGLRSAIKKNEFFLVYQPIVAAESGAIKGVEVLLRWQNTNGLISPGLFIPIAESTGSIITIGEWVFEQSCLMQGKLYQDYGDSMPYLSINLSTKQLDMDGLVERFEEIVNKTGAKPNKILLEITETALMLDVDKNLRTLKALEQIGFNLAVDDFGTGYSSFLQLLRMPVTHVKIDRTFVEGLAERKDSRLVTSAIIKMAKALNKKVVAEGVEEAEQLFELQSLGCDLIQGYYFYKPMREQELLNCLKSSDHRLNDNNAKVFYVIYVSQSMKDMGTVELKKILKQANQFNSKNGITGFLIYNHGYFMQILEGREALVNELLEKIAQDERHTNMRVVISSYRLQRLFPDWSMGFWNMDQVGGSIDFTQWQSKKMNLLELSLDAKMSYAFFTAISGKI